MLRPAASLLIALLMGLGVNSQETEEAIPKAQLVVIGRIEADVTNVETPAAIRADSETATEEERVEVRQIVFRVDRVVKGKTESMLIGAYSLRKIWVPKPESGRRSDFARDLGIVPGGSRLPILKLWELSLVPSGDDRYCPTQRGPCFEMMRDGLRPVKEYYPEGRRLQARNGFDEKGWRGSEPEECRSLARRSGLGMTPKANSKGRYEKDQRVAVL